MKSTDLKAFFVGLYRDLEDRHLLLPAIVLLVAIIAVPMVLGAPPAQPSAPPPTPSAGNAAGTAVDAAVLTSNPGLRDYTQRLEALKRKNPFVQQFAPEPESTGEALDETAADLTEPATGASTGTGTTAPTGDTGTGTAVPGSGGEAPTDTTTAPEQTTPTEPTTSEPTQPQTQTQQRFYAPRVDVTFGELGDTKQYDDVRHFDFLPNEKRPVVAFLGLGESADKAVFAVSNEVAETSGEGSCAPREADGCDLLILRVGEQRMLNLIDGTTYRLKVLDTRYTRIPDPRESSGDAGEDAGGAGG